MRKRTSAGMVLMSAGLLCAVTACGLSGGDSSTNSTGISGKVVTIGFDSTLSGPFTQYNDVALGAEAYLSNLNSNGGVNGYTFKFVSKDNALSASTAVAAFRSLATSSMLVVSAGTAPVQGIKSVADILKVPVLAGANGELFVPPSQYMYGQNPSYIKLAEADARFVVQKLGIKNIAFLYQNDDVGQPTAAVLPAYVKSLGGNVVTQVPVPATATDFSAFAARLQQSGAQAVVFEGGPPELTGVQNAAAALGYNPKWTGLWSLQDKSYTTTVPAQVLANTYSDSYMAPLGNDAESKLYASVVGKDDPTIESSSVTMQGWNFGAIIERAIQKATAGGKALTRDSVLNALKTGFNGESVGFLPAVTYDSTEHTGSTLSSMYTLTANGVGTQVAPMTAMPK